jgi:hypothetical protein
VVSQRKEKVDGRDLHVSFGRRGRDMIGTRPSLSYTGVCPRESVMAAVRLLVMSKRIAETIDVGRGYEDVDGSIWIFEDYYSVELCDLRYRPESVHPVD